MSCAQLCPQFSDEPGCVDSQPRGLARIKRYSRAGVRALRHSSRTTRS